MDQKMFCFQCQEAAKNTGCTVKGVCGKSDDEANMMDLLIYVIKGISIFSQMARQNNVEYDKARVDRFVIDGLFATITNANFDKNAIVGYVRKGLDIRNDIKLKLSEAGVDIKKDELHDAATWQGFTPEEFERKGTAIGVLDTENEDVRSLRELITYGVKGVAAYAEHAHNLEHKNEEIYNFMQDALVATTNDNLSVDELISWVMDTGKHGVDVMALLDKANTSAYGHPEISEVNIGVGNRPGILISGHDMKDMEELLEQTKDTGVDVYTHSEMLPANYYPAFKKYDHFIGNYGNS